MRFSLRPALGALGSVGLFSCQAPTVQFGDTAGPGRPDSTDSGVTGDSDSGSGDNGGGDNGGGSTGDDTEAAPAPVYSGEVNATLSYSEHEKVECSGLTTFTVEGDGALAGSATCAAGPQSVSGGLLGTVLGEGVHGSWRIELGGNTIEVPLSGQLDGTEASLRGEASIGDEAELTVEITAGS